MRGFQTKQEREAGEPAQASLARGFAPGRGAAFAPERASAGPGPWGFQPGLYSRDAAVAQAQNQAPDTVPAMVKPGEFVLPPDTVHAMGGPQALQGVVDATHTPARGFVPRAQREEPRQFFANGGLVEDENPKRPNSFGDAAAAARDAGVTRVGGLANGDASANRIEQVPAAVGMQPDPAAPPPPARGFAQNVQPAQPAEQPTTSSAVRGFAPAPLSTAAPSEPAAAPTSGNVTRVGNSYSGGNVGGEITVNGNTPGGGSVVADGQRTRGFTPASGGAAGAPNNWNDTIAKVEAMGFKQRPSQPLGEPGAATAVAEGGAGAGRGFVNPAPAQPGTAQAQQAAANAGKQTIPGVYQHGRGQYSDNASGMGLPTGFTGQPSAQNQAVADNLVRGFMPGVWDRGASLSADAPRGFAPAGISAPTVRHSGNDWQARNDLRNAQVSASSITQSDKWGKGRDRTATANYAALLRADSAARGAQPGLDQEAMRQNGGLQREAMQQTGETSRTRLQQALADIRERRAAGQQATQNDLARQRLALDTARASRDGVPSGYRPRADGAGLEAIPGGPADKPRDAKLTEDQAKAAGYAVRMQNALSQLDAIGKENPGATRPGAGTALLNMLPEGAANMMRPEGRQRVEAAQLDALDAALTLNTGAAYTREQLQGLSRSYFAQPGDSDKVASEKQLRLSSLIETARLRAGPQGGQMADAAIGRAQHGMATPGQQRIVTRTGALNGRRVVQYSDGSISYAD